MNHSIARIAIIAQMLHNVWPEARTSPHQLSEATCKAARALYHSLYGV
jgi:hypothetical protein